MRVNKLLGQDKDGQPVDFLFLCSALSFVN